MEENAFHVKGLAKRYDKTGFAIQDVELALPQGCVMGLVGENGAGKTTLIKLLLGTLRADAGEITVLGGSPSDLRVRDQLGVVLGDSFLSGVMRVKDVGAVLAHTYSGWDAARFGEMIDQFEIDERKEMQKLSGGMHMKVQIAAALSHGARLLILDEATAGLDPLARDQVLALLRDYLQDARCSVLMSTHITSDLDKIADYIAFLHKGRILLSGARDELLEEMGVARVGEKELALLPKELIVRLRRDVYGASVLLRNRRAAAEFGVRSERATIEEVLLLLLRGEEETACED